eukprot:TRINITY_DN56135_c0_g1_i1.p1 TRINITY_DN56135_c0_g1~~TRINITY_DN56135_c0_g1_i1.p1  ORF type:complete len:479 (+),score=50.41 TRINITY_DN56135_c0_g1_i1:153-1439(+)
MVNVMGTQFLVPVVVQYGLQIGGDLDQVALFNTIRFAASSVATFLLPYLADAWSTKWTLIFGVACSAVGSTIRALAWNFADISLGMMYIGSGIVGVCGAVSPILKAHIPMISMPDERLVDQRLTILGCMYDCVIVLFSPIAGMLGQFSLVYPFWVVVAASVLVLATTFAWFSEPSLEDISDSSPLASKRALRKGELSKSLIDPNDNDEEEQTRTSVCTMLCDPVLCLLFISRVAINFTVVGIPIVLPYFLQDDAELFGVEGDDVESTRENISFVFGLMCSAQGAFSLIFMLFVNEPLSKRWGDTCVTVCGTAIFVTSLGLCAVTTAIWPLYVYFSLFGVGIGLLWRAMIVFPPKYVCSVYPASAARVIAFITFGTNIGSMCGQSVISALVQASMFGGWTALAACSLCSVLAFLAARALGAARVAEAKW